MNCYFSHSFGYNSFYRSYSPCYLIFTFKPQFTYTSSHNTLINLIWVLFYLLSTDCRFSLYSLVATECGPLDLWLPHFGKEKQPTNCVFHTALRTSRSLLLVTSHGRLFRLMSSHVLWSVFKDRLISRFITCLFNGHFLKKIDLF